MSEQLTTTYYPENVLASKRILGFRRRNVIEGLCFALVIGFIICLIPFVTRVKLIFMVVLCLSAFVFGLIGICNMSVTEFISSYIVYKKEGKKYHYRLIEEKTSNEKVIINDNNTAIVNESIADKIYRNGKGYLKDVIKRVQ